MNAAEHLGPEVQFGYRNQLLRPDELRIADAHISTCAACRETLARDMDADGMAESLRAELDAEARPRRGPAFVPFAIAAAVLIAASAAIWFSIHRQAQIDVANLHDRQTPEEREVSENVLRTGRLPLPEFVKGLAPPQQVLMGKATGEPSLELISPVATAVLSARPTFQWKRLDGDWTYVLRVFRPGSEMVAASGAVSGSEWTPEADLPPGIPYEWQIVAQRGTERVTFPQPPQVPPRFRVVDSTTSERLRELAKNRAGVHLLLAIEYGKAGLIEDARRELETELQHSADTTAVRRLIDSLDVKNR
jgi:hypothetical protein